MRILLRKMASITLLLILVTLSTGLSAGAEQSDAAEGRASCALPFESEESAPSATHCVCFGCPLLLCLSAEVPEEWRPEVVLLEAPVLFVPDAATPLEPDPKAIFHPPRDV
jgi:hypothetical protein